MSKHFRFSGKIVGYAGTKDKRGVTSQWCTVKRKTIEELRTFNRPLGSFQVSCCRCLRRRLEGVVGIFFVYILSFFERYPPFLGENYLELVSDKFSFTYVPGM